MKRHCIFCLSLMLALCLVLSFLAESKSQTTSQHSSTTNASNNIKDDITARNTQDDIYAQELSVHGKYHEIIVIKIKNRIYRVADERVAFIDNGKRYYFNDDENSYSHDFELSPDKNWLFVVRKCMHTVGVGYLYHRIDDRKFVPVYPQGLRFDDAAIQFFAHAYGTAQPLLSDGSRIVGFQNWDRDGKGMTFTLTVGETHPRMQKGTDIVGHYDFQKRKFRLIYKKNFFDIADR